MDTSEHCKEVYAYFGLAMYRAQCVEQSLIQLLIFFDFFEKRASTFSSPELWEKEFDRFDKGLSEKTMGRLLKHISLLGILDKEAESMLLLALNKRNWLAHHFFVHHAMAFVSDAGRCGMIEELNELIDVFNAVEDILQPLSSNAASRYGITDEVVEKMMSEIRGPSVKGRMAT